MAGWRTWKLLKPLARLVTLRGTANARTAQSARRACQGFTLVESLITIAVIAILLMLMLPALSRGMSTARAFRCQTSLRNIAFDFTIFGDDSLHPWRGEDERLGGGQFSLETFIESQYGVSEFWSYGNAGTAERSDAPGVDDPMRCPEVRGTVVLTRNRSCSAGAVGPAKHVSYGFNMRLYRPDTPGVRRVVPVNLNGSVLRAGRVPLVWDVDGPAAAATNELANPTFTCPPIGTEGPYASGGLWWPGLRHGGSMNAAFIDGSVGSSQDPLGEALWKWSYRGGERTR